MQNLIRWAQTSAVCTHILFISSYRCSANIHTQDKTLCRCYLADSMETTILWTWMDETLSARANDEAPNCTLLRDDNNNHNHNRRYASHPKMPSKTFETKLPPDMMKQHRRDLLHEKKEENPIGNCLYGFCNNIALQRTSCITTNKLEFNMIFAYSLPRYSFHMHDTDITSLPSISASMHCYFAIFHLNLSIPPLSLPLPRSLSISLVAETLNKISIFRVCKKKIALQSVSGVVFTHLLIPNVNVYCRNVSIPWSDTLWRRNELTRNWHSIGDGTHACKSVIRLAWASVGGVPIRYHFEWMQDVSEAF